MGIKIYLEGLEDKTFLIDVSKGVYATVNEVRQLLSEQSLIPVNLIRLFYRDRELYDRNEHFGNSQLSDYGIEDRSTLVTAINISDSSIDGGIDNTGKWGLTRHYFKDDCSIPRPKQYKPGVVLTHLADVITLDDDIDQHRTLLSCEHAIGPESMISYCRDIFKSGKCEIICPVLNCGREIKLEEVRQVAVLTENELWEFETKLAMNFIMTINEIKKCPRCKSHCVFERNNTEKACIECSICWVKDKVKYRFCWFCQSSWVNPCNIECGNKNCSTENPKKKILRESNTIVIGGIPCPSIRSCPRCKILIEHTGGCPEMECKCNQKFCFICLKQADDRERCVHGSESVCCTKAPIQTEVE